MQLRRLEGRGLGYSGCQGKEIKKGKRLKMKGQRKTEALGKRGDEEKHCKADPKLKLDTSLILANEKEEWFIRITVCITALYSDMATSLHRSLFKVNAAGQANEPILKSVLKTAVSQKKQLLMKLSVEPVMRYDITRLFIRPHLQKKWEIISCYQHHLSDNCTVGA